LITVVGLEKIPLIKKGDDLAAIIVKAAEEQGIKIEGGDVIVVTQKIVSKAEGRVIDLRRVKPSAFALHLAKKIHEKPERIEVILRETNRIVRMRNNHLITETKHGFVCANAGVDKSNVKGKNHVSLLPVNPDESARLIRRRIRELIGVDVAVIISDTFGRPWRIGHVNFAIGVAGMKPIKDYRGEKDMFGYTLKTTVMAIADELASAAELIMGKSNGIPIAIIRGYKYQKGDGSARELIRPLESDLFR
jgi:coenzyme F420-0:L-glutamate ligase/coenzyme F420-1:gamma-L-glutamate ligase